MKLYEVAEEYRVLAEAIENEDSSAEDFAKALGELETEFEGKVESIGKFVLSLRATTNAISLEVLRLLQRQKTLEHKEEWLKAYLHQEMTHAEISKVERGVVTVLLRKSPPSCAILNETLIPEAYQRIIPETRLADKKLITDHWKDTGETVPGAEIVSDKTFIQVK